VNIYGNHFTFMLFYSGSSNLSLTNIEMDIENATERPQNY